MKKTTSLLALIISGGLMITSAQASDIYSGVGSTKDAPTTFAVPASGWTGLWVAALGGMQFSNDVLNFDYNENHNYGETSYSSHEGLEIDGLGSSGLFGELQLGYDRQIGENLVIGIFGGLNIDDGEFSASVNASDSEGNSGSAKISYSQEWGGVIGPRIGLARGNSMFYVAGGWAFGELNKIHASLSSGSESIGGDVLPKQETDLSGWFGEVGIEHKISEGLSVKVAGRYTDYSAITLFKDAGGDENCNWNEKLELDRDNLSAMVGIAYRPQIGNRLP